MNAGPGGEAKVPSIPTERLLLRAHRMDDLAACQAMWADPAVTRYIGGKPSTAQQTWMRMLAYAGHWSLLGFGYWAIADRETDAYLGEIGFADFKRAIAPSIDGVPELGWALGAASWGRGFATEAARAAGVWADGHFAHDRTVCLIDESNVASLRVAAKCGYGFFTRVAIGERETQVFSRERYAEAPVP